MSMMNLAKSAVVVSNANNTGKKNDEGKNRLDLIEPEFIETVGKVLTFGAEEYGPNNWQQVEDAENRYYAAAMRHLMAYRKGEKIDPESKLPHLAHVATNMMFLLHFEREEENDE